MADKRILCICNLPILKSLAIQDMTNMDKYNNSESRISFLPENRFVYTQYVSG